ncbi:MAG: flagellar filament capping protein FliD [Deltaproteobacteria bacterium]|nr:flagellar filament capping protein FliD [Deltaproteobacteria bacterium]
MAGFSVAGLTSGIEYGKLIEQLVSIEQKTADGLKEKKTDYQSKISAYETLSSKLGTMESASKKLSDISTFDVKKAEVTDETILSASASYDATTGNYIISDITALAQAHKITNVDAKRLADKDTTTVLANGQTLQYTVTVDGAAEITTLTASSDLTLEGLVSAINSTQSAANSLITVTATIINDGNAGTPYRLVMTSNTSGSSGGITINSDASVLDLDNSGGTGGTTTLQSAQNAAFKVDGLSISKTSNTVSDVVPGTAFTLKKAAGAGYSYTLTVKNDTDAIKTSIKAMTDAYNEVVKQINDNSKYDTDKKKGGSLFNEGNTESIIRRLRSIYTSAISGLSDDTKVMAQVGLKTNRDGTVTMDDGKLGTKLTSDFTDTRALFINNTSTGIEGVAKKLYDELDDITDFAEGSITVRKKGIQKVIDKYTKDIKTEEDRLKAYEDSLKAKFATLEAFLTTMNTESKFISRRV